MSRVVRDVRTPTEYREVIKAADVLDLGVKEHTAGGKWETTDGEPLFLSGQVDLVKASQSTFHFRISGENGDEVVRATPHRVPDDAVGRRDGYLQVVLTSGAYDPVTGPQGDVDLYQPNA